MQRTRNGYGWRGHPSESLACFVFAKQSEDEGCPS